MVYPICPCPLQEDISKPRHTAHCFTHGEVSGAVASCACSGPSRKQGSTHIGLIESYGMKGIFAEEQEGIREITRNVGKARGE